MTQTDTIKQVLRIGIDVGSTTVKAVVVDERNTILWKDYTRHNAKQPEVVKNFLQQIEKEFPDTPCSIFITGSGGRAIAPYINGVYI